MKRIKRFLDFIFTEWVFYAMTIIIGGGSMLAKILGYISEDTMNNIAWYYIITYLIGIMLYIGGAIAYRAYNRQKESDE